MAENKQPETEKPKLVAKKPDMVIRARITECEAKKLKDSAISGIELRLDFENVAATGEFLEVWFNYFANYQPEIGHIRMKGIMMVQMGEKRAVHYAEDWVKTKKIDQNLASRLLSNVNYRCGTEAIFICKMVDLPSPLVPPPINVAPSDEKADAPVAPGAAASAAAAAARPGARPAASQPPRPAPAAHPPAAQTRPAPTPRPHAAPPPASGGTQQQPPPTARPANYVSPFTGKKPS